MAVFRNFSIILHICLYFYIRKLLNRDSSRVRYTTFTMSQAKIITVNDSMQQGYSYPLLEPIGRHFIEDFTPDLTPKQLLDLGVFGGNYFTGEYDEFPKNWFNGPAISNHGHDPKLNFFKVDASQPLKVWQQKGWIYFEDPRGWFQWYCRYYMGRRIPEEDERQIKRWRAIKRHVSQVRNSCKPGDLSCRPRQRQALLHWAYDSRTI